eukprot:4929258-Prymnesium_polylepis.1
MELQPGADDAHLPDGAMIPHSAIAPVRLQRGPRVDVDRNAIRTSAKPYTPIDGSRRRHRVHPRRRDLRRPRAPALRTHAQPPAGRVRARRPDVAAAGPAAAAGAGGRRKGRAGARRALGAVVRPAQRIHPPRRLGDRDRRVGHDRPECAARRAHNAHARSGGHAPARGGARRQRRASR